MPVLQVAATATENAAAGVGSGFGALGTFGPLVLIFLIFYFLIIRPQNKKQKETEKMIAALKKGDKIVTIGGIHGVVSSTQETTVVVSVDDNTKIKFSRSAIANVIVDDSASKTKTEEKKEEK